jgi:hypothetical protein
MSIPNSHGRKIRLKEAFPLEAITGSFSTISPGPVANLDDFHEWDLLRTKIQETLKFVKSLKSGEHRTGTRQDLRSFVVKATKARHDLRSERAELAVSCERDLAGRLSRFALTL